ncbi:spermidine/spermine N(1)-acetyltransferase [Polaribacter pacificus]|uniref:Spermidine/spermine N(1)-acetyltransferase n=1 Tax=Polaribacter pacificus TaxID=1775173 RepID=A0A917I1B3_9FLAO|nr:GNAT family N-acetyltransferase [Polaribacter pacificus]GGH01265.1 spermidine/spermine N(1)-acetyltransferase [Polaribacter pacificus]
MFSIVKATPDQAKPLSKIAVEAFLTAHGHSAPAKDIESYISKSFNETVFAKELANPSYEYYLIYYNNQLAGYSKIVLNTPNENISDQNVTKLERIYLLEEFYGLQLGKELFNFNLAFSKKNNQAGIWLAVWVENHRALTFYKKVGFQKVGSFNFKVSETHYNPNHIMFLKFE